MNFEHLIEINAAELIDVAPLSRAQLWRGLVVRAEQPLLTVVGLDDCKITECGEDFVLRELRFGSLTIRDRVTFVPMDSVTYVTESSESLPAGQLTMLIEEPFPGSLFVRFIYADLTARGENEDDRLYAHYLKQAYIDADIDTIVTIRRLAGEGLLDGRH